MAYITWSELFSVGVERFDEQHRELVGLINRFHQVYETGQGKKIAFAALNALTRYADEHFSEELRALERTRYADHLKHAREHDKLLEQIFALTVRLEAGEQEIDTEVMEFLEHWLLDHILVFDKAYSAHFTETGSSRKGSSPP